MTTLYCIRCEDTFKAEETPLGLGHETYDEIDTGTPYNFREFGFCDMPDGWAVCPPPESLFQELGRDESWDAWCMENEPGTDDLDNLVLESVL